MKIKLWLLLIFLLAGCSASGQAPEEKAAPEFQLLGPEREEVSLNQYEGKARIVTFWTTWCPTCKDEIPHLQRAQDRYGDKFAVIGVNLTYQDDRKEIGHFLERNDIRFDIGLDKFGEVSKLYGVQALPTTFFIDPEGNIVKKSIGAMSEEHLIEEIEKITK